VQVRAASCLAAVIAIVVTMLGGSVTSAAADDEVDPRHRANFKKVDTYFSVTWRRGRGDCRNSYKLVNAQYRFHRDVRRRYVTAGIDIRQFGSSSCAGDAQGRRIRDTHNACFGCNGNGRNWSRSYSYSPGWPYMLLGAEGFARHYARLSVAVKAPGSSSTVTLGRFCRSSKRQGVQPCP
jgi:hypothetical protein